MLRIDFFTLGARSGARPPGWADVHRAGQYALDAGTPRAEPTLNALDAGVVRLHEPGLATGDQLSVAVVHVGQARSRADRITLSALGRRAPRSWRGSWDERFGHRQRVEVVAHEYDLAARRAFATSGYERATIRAIAAAAEVNPGLVIHYFGSKQELFTQAARISGSSGTETKEHLVESLLGSLGVKLEGLPLEAVTMLRSMLTHPDAARDVRLAVIQQAEQAGAVIDADDAALRAPLIETIMLGVIIGRHLLDLDALHDAEPGQIADLLRPCFEILAHEHRIAPMLKSSEADLGATPA